MTKTKMTEERTIPITIDGIHTALNETVEISFGAVLLLSFLWCGYDLLEYAMLRHMERPVAFLIMTPFATLIMAIIGWACLGLLAWLSRLITRLVRERPTVRTHIGTARSYAATVCPCRKRTNVDVV